MSKNDKTTFLLMAFFIFIIGGFIIFTVSKAKAESSHNIGSIILNIPDGDGTGTALGLAASQHHFDWHTNKWQASIGGGFYDDSQAVSGAFGKKVGDVLLNGSIGCDGACGGGMGATFRF